MTGTVTQGTVLCVRPDSKMSPCSCETYDHFAEIHIDLHGAPDGQ